MPQNTNVLIMRHGEKPDSGPGLSPAGQARAQAYTIYFQIQSIFSDPIELDYLFAAADSPDSHRSRLTLEPLSNAIGKNIDCEHRDHKELVEDILHDSEYNHSNVLICWHHGDILELTAALGVDAAHLPPESSWPALWPADVFGWLLRVSYDDRGNVVPSRTRCINQRLMYGDCGRNPPATS